MFRPPRPMPKYLMTAEEQLHYACMKRETNERRRDKKERKKEKGSVDVYETERYKE